MSQVRQPETALPARQLAARLREWQLQAGRPSTREISRAVTGTGRPVSHVTVADLLAGRRAGRWPVLEAVVRHLGGDAGEARVLWEKAAPPRNPEPDPELAAVNTAVPALLALDPAAQRRVVGYLARRFGCELP